MNRLIAVLLLAVEGVWADDALQIMEQAQKRAAAKSLHYEGTLQVLDAGSKTIAKSWELDRKGAAGARKMLLRFTAPVDIKGVALLILNHAGRAPEEWLWIPAVGRARRIATQDRSTRFFGTGFSFEDLEERDASLFDYKLEGDAVVDGAACWKIESRPKQTRDSQYTRSLLWIRKDNYVVTRTESYLGAVLSRQIVYSDFAKVDGIWTARSIEVFDAARNSRTALRLEKLRYDQPMDDGEFTVEALGR